MTRTNFIPSLLCIGLAATWLVSATEVLAIEGLRTWTSTDGKEIRATLLSTEGEDVLLQLESGREARVPLSRLGEGDRRYVEERKRTGRAFDLAEMPAESEIPREIEVSGGPRVFRTSHFEFETDQDVSRAFISEAARVFEGTLQALDSLPHGLHFAPPGDRTHFRGRFLNDSDFNSFALQRIPRIQGQQVVGLYLGEEKELLVPYSSLGAKKLGSRMTLRKSSDTSTLIHEIVHQVMDDWLPVLPTWFTEGMAEYLAAVPYQNGRFEFRNAERGLRERLESRHRIADRVVDDVIPPGRYFQGIARNTPVAGEGRTRNPDVAGVRSLASASASPIEWGGTVGEYRDAMLAVYYFMHLANPGEPGTPVGAYLRVVDAALEDVDQVRQDLAAFEKERLDYNEQVKRFNASLLRFREEVSAYNERVVAYNDQLRQGIPQSERIEVGSPPVEPVPPKEVVVPGTVEEAARDGAIDLVALVQRTAFPALLQGKTPAEVDRDMKEAFAGIGIEIEYRP